MDSLKQICLQALNYLSRREHTRLELQHKLVRKGFELNEIEQVLTQLQAENWLSEARFIESYIRVRMNKGYGPIRIEHELRERGLQGEQLTSYLNSNAPEWTTRACQVRQKRFGFTLPQQQSEKMKQIRFLQYRGFTPAQIEAATNKLLVLE